jgi:hypothetical protein
MKMQRKDFSHPLEMTMLVISNQVRDLSPHLFQGGHEAVQNVLSTAMPYYCHFEQSKKSFLDRSLSFGMSRGDSGRVL